MKLRRLLENDSAVKDNGEEHRRKGAMVMARYSEDGKTFDTQGNYLCGGCNKFKSGQCAAVKGPINGEAGSCGLWEHIDKSDIEYPLPVKFEKPEQSYTERPNVKGFGCKRCIYAIKGTSQENGRTLYCKFWKMSVKPNACCQRNTGKDDVTEFDE